MVFTIESEMVRHVASGELLFKLQQAFNWKPDPSANALEHERYVIRILGPGPSGREPIGFLVVPACSAIPPRLIRGGVMANNHLTKAGGDRGEGICNQVTLNPVKGSIGYGNRLVTRGEVQFAPRPQGVLE